MIYSLLLLTVLLNTIQVRCVAFSPDGNILAAGCSDGHMYIYGLTNGKWAQIFDIMHHSDFVQYYFLFFYAHY